MNIETIRLTPSPFRVSGPNIDYNIAEWRCSCRTWWIVMSSTTQNIRDPEGWPKREAYWVNNCKLCGFMPRPMGEN